MTNYPFVEGSRRHMSGPNGTVNRIVIHATCSGTHAGGAMQNAHYFQQDTAGGLAHYVVDPGQIVQCCKEDTACWHAPPNPGSIGIELTDPQTGAASRWQSAEDESMLLLAAKLVREIAARHQIPLVRLSSHDLQTGRRGICGHVDVSQAYGQSTHTDPGADFPWAHFMQLVTAATPTPPTTPQEKTMWLIRRKGGKGVYITDWISRRGIASNAELSTITAAGVPAHIFEVAQDVFDRLVEAK